MKLYDGREKFYQYDTNQKLICEDCAVGEEIHFSNSAHGDAAICLTYDLDGVVVVDVPNLYLLSASELNVYSMRTEDDGRCTISRHVFGVIPRKKPSDYVYEETEVKSYAELDRRIKKLEENSGAGIDITGAAAGQVAQIAEVDENGAPTKWQPADLPKVEIPPLKVNLTKDADGEFIASHSASEIIAYAEKGGRVYLTALDLMYMGEYYQNTAKPGGNKSGAQFRYWGINPTGVAENLCYISEDKRLTQTSNAFAVAAMTGATADADGVSGLVPAPAAGDGGKFLRGDGTWGEIDIPDGTTDHTLGISGAAVGQIARITAVDGDGVPTAWESVDLPEGGSGGGGEWTKLGDITVSDTYEFNPISFTGGVVTLDTSAEGYSFMNMNQVRVVFHPIDITSGMNPSLYTLKPKDYAAGTFDVYNNDGAAQTSASMDITKYKMSVPNIGSVEMRGIPYYDRYKVRFTFPTMATHGIRDTIGGNVRELAFNAAHGFSRSGGIIMEHELFTFPYDPNYMVRRSTTVKGNFYGMSASETHEAVTIVQSGEGQTHPVNGVVNFNPSYCPFVNGSRFELWGANDV